MSITSDYWNAQYKAQAFPMGKAPSPFLVEFLPRLSKGKVLDLAMGSGRNAVYMAQKGFEVRGFDISDVAVGQASKLAQDSGVKIDAKAADLDLYLFSLFEFDSVVMTYFKPPLSRYYSELVRTLKQGGTLLIESFSIEETRQMTGPIEPHRDTYFFSNELLHQIRGLKVLYYHEVKIDSHYYIQYLGMKPYDKDALKYGFSVATNAPLPEQSAQQKLAESLFKKK